MVTVRSLVDQIYFFVKAKNAAFVYAKEKVLITQWGHSEFSKEENCCFLTVISKEINHYNWTDWSVIGT